MQELLQRTGRILAQRTKEQRTSWHACTRPGGVHLQGKSQDAYEFGVKVGVATTLKGRVGGGHALDTRQPLRRPHAG